MSDLNTTRQRSELMKRVGREDTHAERVVRRALTDLGLRYRTNVADLPGSPDIAHKGLRKAIFVNGCFWHFHEVCGRGQVPASNTGFWHPKLLANRRRDQRKIDGLLELGFEVLVVWECELDDERRLKRRLREFWPACGESSLRVASTPGSERRAPAESVELDTVNTVLTRFVSASDRTSRVSTVPFKGLITDGDLTAAFDQGWLRSGSRPATCEPRGEVTVVDLFSGCGGMTVGVGEACRALQLDVRPRFAADIDATAREVYHVNFPSAEVSGEDIGMLLPGGLGASLAPEERRLRKRVGSPDIVLGGPPCQGHSDLNNHTRRSDPKNALFAKMARCAEVLEPRHIIVENVRGVLHDAEDVFERTRDYLAELGYGVDWGILRGDELGVPQRRHRVFLVASAERQPNLEGLAEAHTVPPRTVDWAIGDLLVAPGDGEFDEPSRSSRINVERIAHLFEKDIYELPDEMRPACHRDQPHSYKSVYGRIRPEEPAPTITTGFTSMGQGRFVHPYRRRTITPHEAARLQFFPDFFEFGVRGRDSYRMLIGNAVPPKFTYLLALDLLR